MIPILEVRPKPLKYYFMHLFNVKLARFYLFEVITIKMIMLIADSSINLQSENFSKNLHFQNYYISTASL